MSKIMMVAVAAFFTVSVGLISFGAQAADMAVAPSAHVATNSPLCQDLRRCGPRGCHWYHVCTRACPDGYSCSPLYGAYGPYGGVSYWAGYTDSGWSSLR
jgi:hypothetical protein